MSLEKRSTHVRLDYELDRKLSVLAEIADKDKAELASALLSKAISGEWWQFECGLEKLKASGIVRD